jgi:hypothetical protein
MLWGRGARLRASTATSSAAPPVAVPVGQTVDLVTDLETACAEAHLCDDA